MTGSPAATGLHRGKGRSGDTVGRGGRTLACRGVFLLPKGSACRAVPGVAGCAVSHAFRQVTHPHACPCPRRLSPRALPSHSPAPAPPPCPAACPRGPSPATPPPLPSHCAPDVGPARSSCGGGAGPGVSLAGWYCSGGCGGGGACGVTRAAACTATNLGRGGRPRHRLAAPGQAAAGAAAPSATTPLPVPTRWRAHGERAASR